MKEENPLHLRKMQIVMSKRIPFSMQRLSGDRIRVGNASSSWKEILIAVLKFFEELNRLVETKGSMNSFCKRCMNFVTKFKVAEALILTASLLFKYLRLLFCEI